MLIDAEDRHFAALIEGRAPAGFRLAAGGIETPEILTMLQDLANRIRVRFAPAAWMMVEDREIVGLCSLLNAPGADRVCAIGYGVAASRRRRGVARRAVAELLEWARQDHYISAITAETVVDNRPSHGVLEANGFRRTGFRTDPEDGNLICWQYDIDPPAVPDDAE
jgi:RimJ/RimL family protein N-acetyltransferase